MFAGFMMLYETFEARERKREANNFLALERQNSQIGGDPIEIPIDPQYQQQQQQYNGANPGYSREQSVYSQASGYSHHQHGAYM